MPAAIDGQLLGERQAAQQGDGLVGGEGDAAAGAQVLHRPAQRARHGGIGGAVVAGVGDDEGVGAGALGGGGGDPRRQGQPQQQQHSQAKG